MAGPLASVRIVEVTTAIAGPTACKVLGDMGADVIKVESPALADADSVRTVDLPYDSPDPDDLTWRFLNYNTGKRSLTIDLKTDQGTTVFERLITQADAIVENIRPGSMAALGIGWDRLRSVNPELVYCSINGYGREGPYAEFPAVDTLIQGVSGLATQIGDSNRPETTDVLLVDLVTGLYAAGSVAMALFEREQSGTGQRVDVSMLDASVSLLAHQLAEYSASTHDGTEPGYGSYFAPNGYFETKDSYLALLITQLYWTDFCGAIGKPEWALDDHRYATNTGRLEHRNAFREDLEAVLRTRTTAEWLNDFDAREETLLAAPVNDIPEMIEDPRIRAQHCVVERCHPDMGVHYLPNLVPKFARTPGALSDAPGHGEHTDEVLGELGYTAEERDALRTDGIVR